MRRTIARYLVVAPIQTLRCIDVKVKKRFPSLTHLSEAGIITEQERRIIQDLDAKCIQVRADSRQISGSDSRNIFMIVIENL